MKPYDPEQFRKKRAPWFSGVTLSLVSMFVLACMLVVWNKFPNNEATDSDLTIYCAAGIRLPVEEAASAFE